MITFLVIGRNDNYGINLHKRTAISLNYFASLCADEDDEIVYVDCNTPPNDQTLVESIADTLTPTARQRLRVFRVTGDQMRAAIGETPLPFSDELSRNVGIRRSNPRNEWLLSTNCDILLHPLGERSFQQVLVGLPRRFHVCQRVAIPAAQWQMLDRMNVEQVQEFCDAALKQGIRLPSEKEQEWLRFTAVGDFQLAPREQWFEIGGCEEAMKLWGHSDVNNSKRLSILNRGGRTPDLGADFRVIHLDHNPSISVSHEKVLLHNDWKKWVEDVTGFRSHNRDEWGLAQESLQEIKLEAGTVRPTSILKAHRRRRTLLSRLMLRAWTRFWEVTGRVGNWVDHKSTKR